MSTTKYCDHYDHSYSFWSLHLQPKRPSPSSSSCSLTSSPSSAPAVDERWLVSVSRWYQATSLPNSCRLLCFLSLVLPVRCSSSCDGALLMLALLTQTSTLPALFFLAAKFLNADSWAELILLAGVKKKLRGNDAVRCIRGDMQTEHPSCGDDGDSETNKGLIEENSFNCIIWHDLKVREGKLFDWWLLWALKFVKGDLEQEQMDEWLTKKIIMGYEEIYIFFNVNSRWINWRMALFYFSPTINPSIKFPQGWFNGQTTVPADVKGHLWSVQKTLTTLLRFKPSRFHFLN